MDGCLWGGFGTTGQRCTAASRVVVHEKVYKPFSTRSSRGRGRLSSATVSTRMDDGAVEQRAQLADGDAVRGDRADRKGRRSRAAGTRSRRRRRAGVLPRADDLRRRRADDADRAGGDLRAGRLGDPVRSLDEAIAIGNSVDYGLSASIYTQDINRAFQAMRDLYTGIFYVNAPTIGAEVHLPFGGTKTHRQRPSGGRRRRRSTCSRNGSRSTSTSAASFSARRSTSSRFDGAGSQALVGWPRGRAKVSALPTTVLPLRQLTHRSGACRCIWAPVCCSTGTHALCRIGQRSAARLLAALLVVCRDRSAGGASGRARTGCSGTRSPPAWRCGASGSIGFTLSTADRAHRTWVAVAHDVQPVRRHRAAGGAAGAAASRRARTSTAGRSGSTSSATPC